MRASRLWARGSGRTVAPARRAVCGEQLQAALTWPVDPAWPLASGSRGGSYPFPLGTVLLGRAAVDSRASAPDLTWFEPSSGKAEQDSMIARAQQGCHEHSPKAVTPSPAPHPQRLGGAVASSKIVSNRKQGTEDKDGPK